jgi:hypothetical protein
MLPFLFLAVKLRKNVQLVHMNVEFCCLKSEDPSTKTSFFLGSAAACFSTCGGFDEKHFSFSAQRQQMNYCVSLRPNRPRLTILVPERPYL